MIDCQQQIAHGHFYLRNYQLLLCFSKEWRIDSRIKTSKIKMFRFQSRLICSFILFIQTKKNEKVNNLNIYLVIGVEVINLRVLYCIGGMMEWQDAQQHTKYYILHTTLQLYIIHNTFAFVVFMRKRNVECEDEEYDDLQGGNSLQSSSSQSQNKWGLGYRKYSRITPEVKDKLIFLIVRSNMSIKQAAQYLKINYSSAKFIFSQYRDKNFQMDQPTGKDQVLCILKKREEGEQDNIELKYTVGGKYEGETCQLVTAYQIHSQNK